MQQHPLHQQSGKEPIGSGPHPAGSVLLPSANWQWRAAAAQAPSPACEGQPRAPGAAGAAAAAAAALQQQQHAAAATQRRVMQPRRCCALLLAALVACLAPVEALQPPARAAVLRRHHHHDSHRHDHRRHHYRCNLGPSWWCKDDDTLKDCGLAGRNISSCGFSSSVGACHEHSVRDFCRLPYARRYHGGITGGPSGTFAYYTLALYWAPSSCSPDSDMGDRGLPGGFCSRYTMAGSYAATHLVLHGLWADYGAIYDHEPKPPLYNGSYQSWPQYCDGASRCAVVGGACPWPDARGTNFTQHEYEECMRQQHVRGCTVRHRVLRELKHTLAWLAPGYLGSNGTFIDHEWFKHGTCAGGGLSRSELAFFSTALRLAADVTHPGSAASRLVHGNAGGRVRLSKLMRGLKGRAVPTCKRDSCRISELWFCYGRDDDGFPDRLIDCPAGTLAANSCARQGCKHVEIPLYNTTRTAASLGAAQ